MDVGPFVIPLAQTAKLVEPDKTSAPRPTATDPIHPSRRVSETKRTDRDPKDTLDRNGYEAPEDIKLNATVAALRKGERGRLPPEQLATLAFTGRQAKIGLRISEKMLDVSLILKHGRAQKPRDLLDGV